MNLIHSFRSRCLRFGLIAVFFLVVSGLHAQEAAPQRPKITGISHVGYFVSDLTASISYWHDFMGYDVAYDLKRDDGSVRIVFIKINDHQHVELFTDKPTVPNNMMSHICFTVDNVEQMRAYLRSQGFNVKPGKGKTKTGDYAFEIKDPDGMLVEFVQSLPDGKEMQAAGKFMPDTRIANSIYHAGFMVGNSEKSMDFYGRVLGFQETWRGSKSPKMLSWINMRVPDGTDYVELMLYKGLPETSRWGSMNHLSLSVPDVKKAVATLEARPAYKAYGKTLTIATGVNGKRQVNMFDPDGTRVEVMEPFTADGKPVPPSTAPAPTPAHE